MSIPDLLQRVLACGYSVSITPDGPRLRPERGECSMPLPLLADLKANREAVVEYLNSCHVCGRDVSDPEDRERLADPAFCDRGGSRAAVSKRGEVRHPETQRCPFKPRQ